MLAGFLIRLSEEWFKKLAMEMKDQVGTCDSILPRHDEVATNGSYLINLTIKKMLGFSGYLRFMFKSKK